MAELIVAMIERQEPDELASRLLVTEPWPDGVADLRIDAITFSGGVAEYLYGREAARFGDLGADLAHDLRHALSHHSAAVVWDPGQGIRATVIGAAQFSVQISGNTIKISDPGSLPINNLPVIACDFHLDNDGVDRERVASTVRIALDRADFEEGANPVALSFGWKGDPVHHRLHAVAEGICAALPLTLANKLPVVLLIDGDIGMSLGRVIRYETAPGANVIAIDGVQLKQFDYVDIGQVIEFTNVVPIIIKSLLFK
jgi:ethanolamine utilization protein EutA